MSKNILPQKIQKIIAGPKKIQVLIEKIGHQILKNHPFLEKVALIGIQTGGAPLTERLKNFLYTKTGTSLLLGYIDITLYRDDWTRISFHPQVKKSEIPFSIEDLIVILVDDVIYTGRTVRAAMDALVDLGRPKKIELAVLVDRGGREFPIEPTFVGLRVKKVGINEYVAVYFKEIHGKDQICLESR
ncbi:MAG: bifunctional pyr operon transcriptional regulator/uracil phosphoribosyltransferase PyrR [Thermodesulfobacteriaceae bacterium]|nr:bifunctional pyr operon transcriptional regulator/uracil phosphoribosyltransferase PyrR [Thermodesulfobacteriaceae bacterium]MCX8040958.1 bifunctional pyr operon transcriptional regulator/uracil phosphoribosyltransferase PyrR [Thermodesulfobacteriaceae bacterium]MDW8135686.1 bifunctional pyr operon transcriptional regulator/uracil phosphoribosyltransferase PyrR [Thermodesulfobacterium sp.]